MNYKTLLEEHSDKENGFVHPHWDVLAEALKASDEEREGRLDYDAAYQALSKEWMLAIKENLEGGYELSETQNFLFLCNEDIHIRNNLMRQCELSLKLILDEFGGDLDDSGYGKHILIVFKSVDEYFKYTSYFSGDGATPATGGMCINSGYTHIILPGVYDETPVAEITHELTHALLSSYQIPNWINEAIAMRMEDISVGYDGLNLTKERVQEHFDYWSEESIQQFWSGEVWFQASVGFELSYELARILWKKIATDIRATKEEIVEFIRTLNDDDSGNATFKAIFNYSLGDLVEDFLGEGNWEPDESYLRNRLQIYDDAPVWHEELKPLAGLNAEELLLSSVRMLRPSSKLSEYLDKLEAKTIGEFINAPAEKVYEHGLFAKENSDEIQFKLHVLGLDMKYEETLHSLRSIFSLFTDGQIVSGYLESNQCILRIESYLAEMIAPSFKEFKVTIDGFGGYSVEPWQKIEQGKLAGVESIAFDEMLNLKPKISEAEVGIGKLLLTCINSLEDKNLPGVGFSFHASSAIVTDEEGREWSLEGLEKLAQHYWEEG